MSRASIALAQIDYSTPLVLEFNAITALMAISSAGILIVMLLSTSVALMAFFGKDNSGLSEQHFTRS